MVGSPISIIKPKIIHLGDRLKENLAIEILIPEMMIVFPDFM